MPELPEVHTVVNELRQAGTVGSRIMAVRVLWPATIATATPEHFCRQLVGQTFVDLRRRGKFIVFQLDHFWLLVHLRMTGRLYVSADSAAGQPHEHVVLRLDRQRQLRFHDTRKFGRFYLVDSPEAILGRLGPEPLSKGFTAKKLGQRLHQHRRLLKPLLLDQRFLAGLGNIYVDEALWQARLHPRCRSSDLDARQIAALHRAIRQVLRRGIQNRGTTLARDKTGFQPPSGQWGNNRHDLRVFRRQGEPCPRCGSAIERHQVAQRSTYVCLNCQTPPPGKIDWALQR
jgi:formamidopyrimidine-DNA glycosylase